MGAGRIDFRGLFQERWTNQEMRAILNHALPGGGRDIYKTPPERNLFIWINDTHCL